MKKIFLIITILGIFGISTYAQEQLDNYVSISDINFAQHQFPDLELLTAAEKDPDFQEKNGFVLYSGIFNILNYGYFDIAALGTIVRNDLYGVGLAGLFNYTGHDTIGVTLAGIFNYAGGVTGGQVGVINYSQDAKYLQVSVGVINIIGEVEKKDWVFSLGAINILDGGFIETSMMYDVFLNNISLELRTGNNLLYTIISGAMFPDQYGNSKFDEILYGIGSGVGTSFGWKRDAMITPRFEFNTSSTIKGSDFNSFTTKFELRGLITLNPFKTTTLNGLSFIAGVNYGVWIKSHDNVRKPFASFAESDNTSMWISPIVGIGYKIPINIGNSQ